MLTKQQGLNLLSIGVLILSLSIFVSNCGGGGGGTISIQPSIAVTPDNTSINRSGTKQFTAIRTNSDGSTQDITASATWSSSDTSIADVSSTGLATASSTKSGPVTITATSGSISGNAQFMVSINLPKTGQTTSYAAGDDGDLSRGIAWPGPRFVDNGNGTVTDNLTGLVWLKNANCFGVQNWTNALNAARTLNQGECGLTDSSAEGDWRLPNLYELESLINAEQSNNATWLNGQGFSNVQADNYWSSSTYFITPAWVVYMVGGSTSNPGSSSITFYVWPVRAGGGGWAPADLPKTGQTTSFAAGDDGDLKRGVAWPSTRFRDNGDGTVTDNLTGLIWLKDANCFGAVNWTQAVNGANLLVSGSCGLTDGSAQGDWRLANRKELRSLINHGMGNSRTWLNGQGFSNVQSNYWSSSTQAGVSINAWIVYMSDGGVNSIDKTDTTGYAWPVRGGQ